MVPGYELRKKRGKTGIEGFVSKIRLKKRKDGIRKASKEQGNEQKDEVFFLPPQGVVAEFSPYSFPHAKRSFKDFPGNRDGLA